MKRADRSRNLRIRQFDRIPGLTLASFSVMWIAMVTSSSPSAAGQQRMTRVSETSSIWGNGDAARDVTGGSMSASADGRYVAFDSNATNLLVNDVNGNPDTWGVYANIFVKNRVDGSLVRITTGNGYSWDPVLSGDGRYVAFLSIASNLVANDTNSKIDVFLHDRDPDGNGIFDEGNGTTILVSVDSSGNQCNGDCSLPSISDDGSLVVFISNATNLVSGDTNGANDAFLRDVAHGKTLRVSVGSAGNQAKFGADCASIAPNGSVVAFDSYSGDIVSGDSNGDYDVFIYDVNSGVTTERVSVSSSGGDGNGNSSIIPRCLSHDGTIVAFSSTASNLVSGDTNGSSDIFIRSRPKKTTKLASLTSGGQIGNFSSLGATINATGDRVAFHSDCTNLGPDYNGAYDVYVHDFANGTTTLVSANRSGIAGDLESSGGVISPDGDFVVFDSDANDIVTGDQNGYRDVFTRDLKRSTTECISWIPPGQAAGVYGYDGAPIFNGDSDVSGDGRWVAFASVAENLVPNTNNGLLNIFVKDRLTGRVVRVSINSQGIEGDGDCFWPSISFDGRFVSFMSTAENWFGAPYLYGPGGNIYVYDRDPDGNGIFDEGNGALELISVTSGTFHDPVGQCFISSISGSGRYVAFSSFAGWLMDSRCPYYDDHNDVLVCDRLNRTISLVSFDSTGTTDANSHSDSPAFSSDDSTIVYRSVATNILAADNDSLADIYSWNLATGTTTLISVNTAGVKQKSNSGISRRPVSSDGKHIVFMCNDPSFDPSKTTNHYDVYLRDLTSWPTATTTNLTTTMFSGGEPNSDSLGAVISRDSEFVAFASDATNLFAGDKNGGSDVFWYDRVSGDFTVASTKDDTISGDDWSNDPVVLDSPGQVVFASGADDLVHDDTNGYPDLFAFDPTVSTGAAWIPYGAGFPGTHGVPSLTMSDDPVLGTSVSMLLGNSKWADTVGLLLVSPRSAHIPTNYGATWLVDLSAFTTYSFSIPAGGLSIDTNLPSDPSLVGASIYLQNVELDSGAVKHLSFSRGLELYFQFF